MHTLTALRPLLLLPLLLLGGCSDETAPPPPPKGAAATEQPAPRLIGDIARGKVLAQPCARCHGLDGIAAKEGAPFIAGVAQEYLIRSMLAYANGAREHTPMREAVEALQPEALGDVSAYYASLTAPWRNGAIVRPTPPQRDRMAVARGKAAANACDTCHGPEHRFSKPEVPSLAGMRPGYFSRALRAYYNGERHDRIMALLEYSLTEQKSADLAAYYAAQTPYAPPAPSRGDAKRGRSAARPCAGCHGSDGNSPNPGVPSLTGHPAAYLVKATTDYRDGRRHHNVMREAVARLTDATIRDIAAHYASQPPDNTLFAAAGSGRHFDPIGDGGRIASACNGCHGSNGNSSTPGTPSLTGVPVKYLIQATAAYRDGARRHPVMKTMVDFLDDVGIEKVALFYAMQEPQPRRPPAGDPSRGEALSRPCANCHGKGGVSHDPQVPSLAGQEYRYLIGATNAYLNGRRDHEGMQGAVEALQQAEVEAIAAFYAAQPAQKPQGVYAPEPTQALIEKRCILCHDQGGFSSDFDKPRLAGQSERYLIEAMRHYAIGTRKHHAMQAMAEVLSRIEIEGVAAYYARQQKREPAVAQR